MKKKICILLTIGLLCVASAFTEVVTCPHCGKGFDTSYGTAKKPQVNGSAYEVITIKRFKAMGKNYEGKKISFKNVKISSISSESVYFYSYIEYDGYTGEYNDSIVEQLLSASESGKSVNVYGTVKPTRYGSPEFYIEAIQ